MTIRLFRSNGDYVASFDTANELGIPDSLETYAARNEVTLHSHDYLTCKDRQWTIFIERGAAVIHRGRFIPGQMPEDQRPATAPGQNTKTDSVHKFVLGRCIHCNLPVEKLEQSGWDCRGHQSSPDHVQQVDPPRLANQLSLPAAETLIPSARLAVEPEQDTRTTDIFAILTFGTGLLSLLVLPIILAPICYVSSIISYYRLKENPNLKGKGLRISGFIFGIISIIYMFITLRS